MTHDKQLLLVLGVLFACTPLLQARELTLHEAVALALAHNPAVAAAGQDVVVLRSKLEQVRALARPQANIALSFSELEQQPVMSVPSITLPLPAALGGPQVVKISDLPLSNTTIALGAIDVQYPLYTGGRIKYGLEQVHDGMTALQLHAQAVRNDVALQTVQAYLGAVLAQRVATVNDEAYDTVKAHEVQAEALFRQGMVPKYEWMRAQTEEANQDRRRLDAHNQADLALAYLQDLLSIPDSDAFTLTTPLRGDEQYAVELAPAESAALAASQDLQSLHCRDAMYVAAEKAAMAEKAPTVSLLAAKQLYLNSQPYTSPEGFIGLEGNIPLLDGGLSRARREEQQALRVRNQDDIKQLCDGIQLEVHKYYLDLLSARKALNVADQAVALAQESLRLATRRFEESQGTGVEKTDAILALSLAETNREQARYQNDLAYYGLKKTMGELLPELAL